MAAEALAGARRFGVDFAAADGDGDGEVDGVLLLHAGVGLENDPAGLIVPLRLTSLSVKYKKKSVCFSTARWWWKGKYWDSSKETNPRRRFLLSPVARGLPARRCAEAIERSDG